MVIPNFTGAFGSVARRQVGQQPPVPMPTQAVGQFKNQQLGGLISGNVGQAGAPSTLEAMAGLQGANRPQNAVQMGAQRMTDNVALSNKTLMGNAVVQRTRNDALKRAAQQQAQPQQQQQQGSAPGNTSFRNNGAQSSGGTAAKQGGWVVGQAGQRIENLLTKFPGLHITETLGDRNYDQQNGVARRAQSYHYDKNNPAVDIGGSTAQLNSLYKELVRQGGWRQILWQTAGHYDHIHIA